MHSKQEYIFLGLSIKRSHTLSEITNFFFSNTILHAELNEKQSWTCGKDVLVIFYLFETGWHGLVLHYQIKSKVA